MFSSPEDLYLTSLDAPLTATQQEEVRVALEADGSLARSVAKYQRLRQHLQRADEPTFGPFFPETVVQRIRNLKDALDHQIVLFFRRYQLAAWGILVALLIINLALADQLSVPSVMGIEEAAQEDVLTFDFINDLTK
jgi:hypothetical protein